MKELLAYFPLLKESARSVFAMFAVSLVYALLAFSTPWLYKIAFDDLMQTYDRDLLFSVLILIAALIVLSMAANTALDILAVRIRTRIGTRIRQDMMSDLLGYPYRFFLEWEPGAIIQRVITETDSISSCIVSSLRVFCHLTQLLLIFILVMLNDARVFAIYLVACAVYVALSLALKPAIADSERDLAHWNEKVLRYFFGLFPAIVQVKLFNMEGMMESRLADLGRSTGRAYVKQSGFQAAWEAGPFVILRLAFIVLLVALFGRISQHEIPTGLFLVFVALGDAILNPFMEITRISGILQAGAVAAARVREIRGLASEDSGKIRFETFHEDIEFREVSLSFGSSKVLDRASFRIKKGQHVALLGPSGSGKSTLAYLLAGLYRPDSGTILIDGKAHAHFSGSSLREKIGVFSQDPFIGSRTIREALDKNGVMKDDEICGILRMVGLASLSGRIDEALGENGSVLSGGERQRLALARFFARPYEIIVLDEATSSLDAVSEAIVMDSIRLLRSQRPNVTLLTIAHRQAARKDADLVYAVEAGKVRPWAETGSFINDQAGRVNGMTMAHPWKAHD